MNNQEYLQLTKEVSPGSKVLKNCSLAFLVGGLICLLGQLLIDLYKFLGLDAVAASTVATISLVAISIILTGLNIYPKIASFAGAGTLVPITGFANAVASPAIEFKTEGHILGLGAKLFSIAGPVIVYGVIASFIYGVILFIISLF